MRRTALFLSVLLIFTMVSPYTLYASENKDHSGEDYNQQIDDEISDVLVNDDKTLTDQTENTEEQNLDEVQEVDEPVEKEDLPESNVDERKSDDELKATSEDEQLNDEVKEENSDIQEEEEVDPVTEVEEDDTEQSEMRESEVSTLSVSESATSMLGHIRHSNVDIYKDIKNLSSSFKAGTQYTNAVYYIKRQAVTNDGTYYLLSTLPSSTKGVVGWVKSTELSTHNHKTVDKKSKTFYVKGTGKAYSKAWGGSKDLVYQDMSQYAGQVFNVNLTETVGNNTWYRGELNGKIVWLHSSYVSEVDVKESTTSKLGHLHGGAVIYKDIKDKSSGVSSKSYTNAVYYIKKQAVTNDGTYYLISTLPSSTKGVVGWVKSTELSTHNHKTVDKKSKTFYVKGTGKAYSKAWGGSKDLVYQDMSQYAGQVFNVNLTETVGNNTWYRGELNGKQVWLHSSYVTSKTESDTSRLGHLRKGATIYKVIGDPSSTIKSDGYLNAVYYIKRQANVNGEIFYLINTLPRKENSIGWVNSKDMTTHSHVTVNKTPKVLYIKGTGNAYSKAWGGSKDLVYSDLSQFEGEVFKVNLTEKVGSNTWYRGILNGKTAWIHSSYVAEQIKRYSSYNITLAEALSIQMTASPQTDKDYNTYVSKTYVDKNNKVTAETLNVRGGAGTNYWVVGQLKKGTKVNIIDEVNGWYQIEYTKNRQWVNPNPNDVLHYLDPNNFINDERQKVQFLDLSKTSGASVATLNNYLKGKGTLQGQGKAFIEASQTHGVNDIYLISHAILETGNGNSVLAKGVKYNGVTVYNMFGVGAYDKCPVDCGAKKAYEEGWTTPEKAIVGGAEFIGNSYIKAGQNTLYKMRWNPAAMALTGAYGKQYATDIGWASKQVNTMYNLYQTIGIYNLNLDIPVYKR